MSSIALQERHTACYVSFTFFCILKGVITNYGEGGGGGGGLQNGRKGASEVLPRQKKGRTEKILSMLKGRGGGGVTNSFNAGAILMGHENVYPVLRGGGTSFGPRFFPFRMKTSYIIFLKLDITYKPMFAN